MSGQEFGLEIAFVDDREKIFRAVLETIRIVGKTDSIDSQTHSGRFFLKKGLGLSWKPVAIGFEVLTLTDRTILQLRSEQLQRQGTPDLREKSLAVFDEHLARRKELTRLD